MTSGKSSDKNKTTREEFSEFMAGDMAPPRELDNSVRAMIHARLHPAFGLILMKLAALHAVVGTLSLLVCSQFGFGSGHVLSHWLMGYGETACMLGCGSLFLGSTSVAALFVLSREELKKIRSTGYLAPSALGLVSLGVFLLLGAEIQASVAVAWFAGAIAASILSLEAGRFAWSARHAST